MDRGDSFFVIIGLIACAIAAAVTTGVEVKDDWRAQAVKHHAAEFYLDANHDRQWRWLDEKPSSEVRP